MPGRFDYFGRMTWDSVKRAGLLLVAGVWLPCGCGFLANRAQDDQRDPHFLRGKSLAESLDYAGAVEAFEKALEANPNNASAHFELWWLYEQKLRDHAASIYHGDRFLRLRPQDPAKPRIFERRTASIQELAKEVPLGPVTPALESLSRTNRFLRQQLDAALAENKVLQQQVETLTRRLMTLANPPAAGAGAPARQPAAAAAAPAVPAAVRPPAQPAAPPAPRTHTIRAGDTLSHIALAEKTTVKRLLSANPGLDPRRLKVGQKIQIPSGP